MNLFYFLGFCLLFYFPSCVTLEASIDCYPEPGSDPQSCENRGCVWTQLDVDGRLGASEPWCTYPEGYGYEQVGDPVPTTLGYELTLNRKSQPTIYGNDVDTVALSVEFWQENILRLKFYDPENVRYEVPIDITQPTSAPDSQLYSLSFTNTPQFGISVIRNSTGTVIFNTSLPGFVFSDQYLSISTIFPSINVYGFGENAHHQLRHDLNWMVWSMFARDNGPQNSYNLYGVQPFYMNVEYDGNTNGVFLLNSNAMEIELQPAPAVTYRTIGGILDFYIFLGPTPEDVVKQYTQLIGRPYMPPYWGLGFQLSRWGYANTAEVRSVTDSMRANGIPYDVQYTDIDYMDNHRDFTLSSNFSDLPEFIDDLHEHGQYYIPILDPGISDTDPGYYAYQQGLYYDVFVKYPNGTILEGNVWPGNVYYPDFSHDNAVEYWSEQCSYMFTTLGLEFDGLWIDMNEPSNFVVGSTSGCNNNTWNYPPYVPAILGADPEGKLTDKTICMDAVLSVPAGNVDLAKQYNTHSLYGYFMSKTTQESLLAAFPQRRPFVFSRSQFPGANQYAHHWLGDNNSSFTELRDSIVGIQEYNIFGTPFVGADICGFNENTFVELCIRWMQLGSFYSFARNHNTQGAIAQDPPSLGPEVVNASIKALTERYRLLPYLYTLLYQAHTTGSTVIRPLFHEFPTDSDTWTISFQFLWGSSLLVSPCVNQNDSAVDAYFPPASYWYDYYHGNRLLTAGWQLVEAPLDGYIPLHVRGGSIIPTQQPSTTTTASRLNPMGLLVALDEVGEATGLLYWDDGTTYNTQLYNTIQYSFENNILDVVVVNNGFVMSTPLDSVTIYGLKGPVTNVIADIGILPTTQYTYDNDYQVLKITQLNMDLSLNHHIEIQN